MRKPQLLATRQIESVNLQTESMSQWKWGWPYIETCHVQNQFWSLRTLRTNWHQASMWTGLFGIQQLSGPQYAVQRKRQWHCQIVVLLWAHLFHGAQVCNLKPFSSGRVLSHATVLPFETFLLHWRTCQALSTRGIHVSKIMSRGGQPARSKGEANRVKQ